MEVLLYRLVQARYAAHLQASGRAARWNKAGEEVIYAASSRALASLELLVHRQGLIEGYHYKMMLIKVNSSASAAVVSPDQLPENWRSLAAYHLLQEMGSNWYQDGSGLLLQVPSAVIPQEPNFVIHARHPAFASKIRVLGEEDFFWDQRLL